MKRLAVLPFLLLVPAGQAHAATVDVVPGPAGPVVRMVADPGETNFAALGIFANDPARPITVVDSGATLRSSTCAIKTQGGTTIAECPRAGITAIEADLGDGDDYFTGDDDATLPVIVRGGEGSDTIGGAPGSDQLDGGPGNDKLAGLYQAGRIFGPDAADTITGGPGDDEIDAETGGTDSVDCGDGADRVARDAADNATACESRLALEFFFRGLVNRWRVRGDGRTRVLSLRMRNLPFDTGTTATVRCAGRGCPFSRATRRPRPTGKCKDFQINLTGLFKGARLAPGTRVTVRVSRRGYVTRTYGYTMRATAQPRRSGPKPIDLGPLEALLAQRC